MSYKVEYTSKARNDLKKLPLEIAQGIIRSINRCKDDPYPHVKKIKGTQKNPLYTHRVGEYRVILHIENKRLLIVVIEAGQRKKIYRKHENLKEDSSNNRAAGTSPNVTPKRKEVVKYA